MATVMQSNQQKIQFLESAIRNSTQLREALMALYDEQEAHYRKQYDRAAGERELFLTQGAVSSVRHARDRIAKL